MILPTVDSGNSPEFGRICPLGKGLVRDVLGFSSRERGFLYACRTSP